MFEQLIHIAQEERKREIPGLQSLGNDLNQWMVHYRRVQECLANFSIHMQMPCVCITEADLKRLVAENPQTIEANDGYYHLSTESRIDADSYRIWVNSLK